MHKMNSRATRAALLEIGSEAGPLRVVGMDMMCR